MTNKIILNKRLLEQQGIDKWGEERIIELHRQLDDVLEHPELYNNPVYKIEQLEFWLQEAWGFEEDRNMHSYWHRIKGCTCPNLDNLDRRGTTYRVISGSCPWHSVE